MVHSALNPGEANPSAEMRFSVSLQQGFRRLEENPDIMASNKKALVHEPREMGRRWDGKGN